VKTENANEPAKAEAEAVAVAVARECRRGDGPFAGRARRVSTNVYMYSLINGPPKAL
jgi:hypothetical protein